MPTPMQNAIDSLRTGLLSSAGVSIAYVQGATTVNLQAIPGQTKTETDQGDGVVRQYRMADFIVQQSALGLTPARGDTITYDSRRYVVANPSGGKCYDEVGPYAQMYRIHTKEINAS